MEATLSRRRLLSLLIAGASMALATAPLQVLEQPLHEPRGILELLTSLKDAERQLLDRHPEQLEELRR